MCARPVHDDARPDQADEAADCIRGIWSMSNSRYPPPISASPANTNKPADRAIGDIESVATRRSSGVQRRGPHRHVTRVRKARIPHGRGQKKCCSSADEQLGERAVQVDHTCDECQ
jgi:hypothetical protein